jgi:hypothetical protein
MDPPLAFGRLAKEGLLVRAQDGYNYKQEAERNRPSRDHVGPWAHTLRSSWPRAPTRVARRWRCPLDKHQTLARSDFPYSAAPHWPRAPAGCDGRAPLSIPAALDPLAHILDVGPPSTGLGSSWHWQRC